MRMIDIIERKRDNFSLTKQEISFFIDGYVNKLIPDYQISALLMAIYFNGMNKEETIDLTKSMLNSGTNIDLSLVKGIKVDKHSTGGVGDKVSLVLAPLLAACGLKIAKMSGRGLGHTGGTIDKLEAIEGFNINLSNDEFIKQLNQIGIAIIGQTTNLVLADKLLYALRDVTGTVNSIPLIASSIMSKKLAINPDILCLDVKVGKGAFMKNMNDGIKLAELMVQIGEGFGVKTIAVLSDMNEPLGWAVGNNLEVIEAINTLQGNGPKDFTDLVYTLAIEILMASKITSNKEDALKMLNNKISNNEALEKLKEMVVFQGGNKDYIDQIELFSKAKKEVEVKSSKEGFVMEIDALAIGVASMKLGSGRKIKTDIINPSVGIVIKKKCGEYAYKNDILAVIHTDGIEVYQEVLNAFIIGPKRPNKKTILQIIGGF